MDFENSTYDANLEFFLKKIGSINTAGQRLKHENHSMLPHLTVFLIFSYINQQCHVAWNGEKSTSFSISNGVRQGAVASPAMFNTYINQLFDLLATSGVGCKIDHLYYGVFAYADDIALIAPSREGLQKMVDICDAFFTTHGINISTSPIVKKTKTKIITFGADVAAPTAITLGSKILPYVTEWKHLGHVIHQDENPVHDLMDKKRELTGKFHSLQQELGKQDPGVLMRLVKTYILHLYGCTLWDIFSEDSVKLWSEWHRIIKQAYQLPIATHRWLLSDLLNGDHVKKMIIKRFLSFSKKISNSNIPHIAHLHQYQCKDWRSTYGRNHMYICTEAQVADISSVDISSIVVNPIPTGEEWRAGMLRDILTERECGDGVLTPDEVNLLLNTICCD